MRSRILFILGYFIFWVLVFEIGRLIFITYQLPVPGTDFAEAAKALRYGIRMDFSMAAYLTLPVALGMGIHMIKPIHILKKGVYIYSIILFFFISLLLLFDLFLFEAWGYHIDAAALSYLNNPAEAYASTAHLPVFWILVMYLVMIVFSNWVIRKLLKWGWPQKMNTTPWYYSMPIGLVFLGSFIIPLRGGFQLAPMNQSTVFFSTDNFANQSAINVPWNFMHSITHNSADKKNPYLFLPEEVAQTIVDSLYNAKGQTQYFLRKDTAKPINVIYIIWESFTEKAMHVERNGVSVTPRFNQLKSEGIYFSNIYASGDRTDKGIVAILSSFPAQPKTSIVKIPSKVAKLPMLSELFNQHQYFTSFYYGGELEFANMKAYLTNGNFKHFTSINDFAEKDRNSKWGAHDGVVMEKLFADLNQQPQPFFTTWLTLSSHEPFETPVPVVIQGQEPADQFLNSLHYTDQVLYDFITRAKTTDWWKHSLLVITADHGHRLPVTGKKADDFRIPVLLLGGALNQTNLQNDRVGSQLDITPTILRQLGWDASAFIWGKNLADSSSKPWAYFSFNNGFGFLNDKHNFIYDNISRSIIAHSTVPDTIALRAGQAMEQLTVEDYLQK